MPDLQKWAKVINHFLKPGGQLVFVEFHPFLGMYDNNFTFLQYSYFNDGVIVETNDGTYADRTADLANQEVNWNHPTSEVLTSLFHENLELKSFQEYNWSPYPCFANIEETEKGKYQILQFGSKIPYVFSLVAQKKI